MDSPRIGAAAAATARDRQPRRSRSWSPRATIGRTRSALGIGKSVVIDLPRDIKDVLVADPKIANAMVRSVAPRLYHRHRRRSRPISSSSTPKAADGRLRHRGDARSQRHPRGDQASIPVPEADIIGRGHRRRQWCCSGTAPSQAEAQQACDIAVRLRRRRHRRHSVFRLEQQGRQRDRRPRPRPGHAQSDRRRDRARRRSSSLASISPAARLRHGRGQFQQYQPVLGQRPAAQSSTITGGWKNDQRRRCRRWSRPASSTRWPSRPSPRSPANPQLSSPAANFPSSTASLARATSGTVPECSVGLPALDPVQELRRRPELHSGRAQRRPHQPQRDDRSVGLSSQNSLTISVPDTTQNATVPSIARGARTRRSKFPPAARWRWPA